MHDHWMAISIIAVTGAVSLALAMLAVGAWRRTGNRKLVPVLLAFWLFVAKAVITAYSLHTGAIGHEDLEVVGAILDLGIVALLMAPFVAPLVARRPQA